MCTDIFICLALNVMCVQPESEGPLNDSSGSLRTLSGNSLSNFLNDLVSTACEHLS